jgi:hypothetical protein
MIPLYPSRVYRYQWAGSPVTSCHKRKAQITERGRDDSLVYKAGQGCMIWPASSTVVTQYPVLHKNNAKYVPIFFVRQIPLRQFWVSHDSLAKLAAVWLRQVATMHEQGTGKTVQRWQFVSKCQRCRKLRHVTA